ncbi:MAG: hypothetical protein Q9171_007447 [Xanthocarpia ochracea]
MDRSIHKRRRGVHPGLDRDRDLAMRSGYEDRHRSLFISRPTSEEPPSSRTFPTIKGETGRLPGYIEGPNAELKFNIPSFLDDEDEKAFIQKGFRAAVPATHVHGVKPEPGTASRSHDQPQRPTSSSYRGLKTIIKSEPPIQESAPSSPVSQPGRSSSAPTQRSTPPSSTRVIKAPREPNKALKRNTTSLYARYDPIRNNVGPLAGTYKGTYRIYDAYSLVIDPTMTIGQLPTSGVRVDDFHAGKLLMSSYTSKILFQAWPAEFDHNGMIRATRIPLGHAAKCWRRVGATDIDGNVVQSGQEGWYYDWWRGLHCLMGKEGYDAGLYLVRPSFETFRCEGMTFKIDYKAIVQLPTDDPNDPTPGL